MALPDVTNIRTLRGWLCKNPTDLNLPFPHGGTALGLVRDGVFRPGIRTRIITAEEFGGTAVEGIYAGESCILSCLLREFDEDALTSVFPNYTTVARYAPADDREVRPGNLTTERQHSLLFSPRDVDDNPFIILYKVLPMVEESMQLQLMISTEATMGVIFQGIPDGAGRCYEFGKKTEITL